MFVVRSWQRHCMFCRMFFSSFFFCSLSPRWDWLRLAAFCIAYDGMLLQPKQQQQRVQRGWACSAWLQGNNFRVSYCVPAKGGAVACGATLYGRDFSGPLVGHVHTFLCDTTRIEYRTSAYVVLCNGSLLCKQQLAWNWRG